MRNPTRRSRNIGTAKQGHGQNNEFSLPVVTRPALRFYWENVRDYKSEIRVVGENRLTFIVETPRPAVAHACTVDEIVHVLSLFPAEDLRGLELVVLRQPKRKEELLNPVWGRYIRFVEIGNLSGTAIVLEALDSRKLIRWPNPLGRGDLGRLEKLRSQGHTVRETPRFYEIYSTLDAVKQTQLWETLPHEVGHHVHALTDPDFANRTKREKEDFAERYEREFIQRIAES